jgi:transcriptional regulator with XRE-family HTH domain
VAARQLREVRRRSSLSQRALVARSAVPQPTISAIEKGRREPSISLLSRLTEAAGYELKVELQPLPRHSAVATANRVRGRLFGAEGDGWPPTLREDGALRAVIDFKDALLSASSEEFTRLVEAPPSLTGDTRWDAFIAAVVEDQSANLETSPPQWTNEQSRFVRPFWYLSDNKALHSWELATAPGAFVRHGVLAAREELESV